MNLLPALLPMRRASAAAAGASRAVRVTRARPTRAAAPKPDPVSPMRPPVVAYVGLGANLGDAAAALKSALAAISQLPGTRVARVSRFYRSAPVEASGPDFLNAVAEVETSQPAPRFLAALQGIERRAGRERPYRHAPRTLDLDLLLYGEGRIESPALTVPHPRMRERAFVLLPLAELAPARVEPQDLQAAAGQRIARLPRTSLP